MLVFSTEDEQAKQLVRRLSEAMPEKKTKFS